MKINRENWIAKWTLTDMFHQKMLFTGMLCCPGIPEFPGNPAIPCNNFLSTLIKINELAYDNSIKYNNIIYNNLSLLHFEQKFSFSFLPN